MERCRGHTGGVDELGDAIEPVVIEVVGRTVTQKLTRHEHCSLLIFWPVMSVRRRNRG